MLSSYLNIGIKLLLIADLLICELFSVSYLFNLFVPLKNRTHKHFHFFHIGSSLSNYATGAVTLVTLISIVFKTLWKETANKVANTFYIYSINLSFVPGNNDYLKTSRKTVLIF